MKCSGDILVGQINKATLPLQYKYLLHILIQCLGKRKAGYDTASSSILGMMTALTLNKDFNFSREVFENMKENLEKQTRMTYKFWMYPRFRQIIIDTQVENLPKEEKNMLKIDVMTEHTLKVLKRISKYDEGPVPRKMIGYLGNPNYVTPANDKWTNDVEASEAVTTVKTTTEPPAGPTTETPTDEQHMFTGAEVETSFILKLPLQNLRQNNHHQQLNNQLKYNK
ncbi:hypothetical protein Hdeb2414_s0007g00258361 [Helianthus debilis subsp. tardiflorus]